MFSEIFQQYLKLNLLKMITYLVTMSMVSANSPVSCTWARTQLPSRHPSSTSGPLSIYHQFTSSPAWLLLWSTWPPSVTWTVTNIFSIIFNKHPSDCYHQASLGSLALTFPTWPAECFGLSFLPACWPHLALHKHSSELQPTFFSFLNFIFSHGLCL